MIETSKTYTAYLADSTEANLLCFKQIRNLALTSIGCLEEAAEVAFQQRDLQSLLYMQNKCGNQSTSLPEKINNMITQLDTRR
ncbi:unnamed protein product [Acanthoscelides obtectus]|uniref:Uncharacterized protein n=1 Tax=Acanthoscelides obtectus TaxID=200917 RepID=A0A9P0Q3R8_ACAOB|nr:unnamed protein product [Acanthoscelides obtectus]CAK1655903.1 hypothetical protein AOBTE_LOCUS19426 [Acanthoscelides obtectus]